MEEPKGKDKEYVTERCILPYSCCAEGFTSHAELDYGVISSSDI